MITEGAAQLVLRGALEMQDLKAAIRANAVPVLLVVALGVLCAQLSFRLRAETLASTFQLELEALHGRARFPEFQNRLIAPGMLAFLRWLLPAGMPDRSVWYLDRLLQAALAYCVLYGVCLHLTRRRMAGLLAVALVTFAYVWTPMTHHLEYTSDFFDVIFAALIVACVLEERRTALALVVVVAALNRESALFAGVIWMTMVAVRHGIRMAPWRQYLLGVFYIALAAAVILAVRIGISEHYNPRQQLGILEFLVDIHIMLHPTGITPMLFFTSLLFGACLARLPRPWMPEQKGLLVAALICAVISGTFGIISELRVFLPCWVMLAIAIVITPRPQTDQEWIRSMV